MKIKIIELDLEGKTCPYPLLMCIKKFKEIKKDLESGKKLLKVIVDCPAASENIPLTFKKKGFQVKVKEISRGKWEIIIQQLPSSSL